MMVYSINNKSTTNCIYIGSSKNSVSRRLNLHKSKSKAYPNRKLYKYIIENGSWDNFEIVILEEFDDEINLKQKEREYYDIYKPICNTYRPIVSHEEDLELRRSRAKQYYYDDIENKKQKHRKWYANKKAAKQSDS